MQAPNRARAEFRLKILAGTPADDFGQVGFADARIADDAHTGTLAQEVEIQPTQDPGLQL